MSELAVYTPPSPPQSRDTVDGWVSQAVQIQELANAIAGTEFVPKPLRGKPAAVTAAILTGRELGIGPMTALSHLNVIDGRPSMSSQLMRALVLAAGHSFRVVESTTTKCTVAGKRRGESEWSSVTWTMDDARQANLAGKVNWKTYPRAQLIARATGELCRNVFADVLGGMAYTSEEMADTPDSAAPDAPAAAPSSAGTTRVSRKRSEAPAAPVAEPELPDAAPEAQRAIQSVPEASPPMPPEHPDGEGFPAGRADEPASREQARMVFALLGEIDPELNAPENRDRRLALARVIVGKPVDSFNDLTVADASALIDTLARVSDSDDSGAYLEYLLTPPAPAPEIGSRFD
jgi:hypothetical protein